MISSSPPGSQIQARSKSKSRSRSPNSRSDRAARSSSVGSSAGVASAPIGSSANSSAVGGPHILFDLHTSQDGFNKQINLDGLQSYEIRGKIGEGSFGVVFDGYDFRTEKTVAIKIIKQQRAKWVKREAYILSVLAGKPNIVELLDIALDRVVDVPLFVFAYVPNVPWNQLYPSLDMHGMKSYSRQLLNALHYTRESGILHRDVKPANILYDIHAHHLVLIDWGTADVFHPEKNCGFLVGTREFRSPELLMQCVRYDYSIDMWSAGCVLGQIFLGQEPLFGVGENSEQQLIRLVARYGSDAVKQCLEQGRSRVYQENVWQVVMDEVSSPGKSSPSKEWSRFGAKTYRRRIHDCEQHGLLKLLDGIMQLNPSSRLLPSDALRHTCFADFSNSS